MDLQLRRLGAQRLAGPRLDSAAAVVGWLGAVQSQDYPAAALGLSLRSAGADRAAIDAAFDAGQILRTHVMRPTWHFLLPEDARALIELTGPRVLDGMKGRHRRLEIDEATTARALHVMTRALTGGRHLTRQELAAELVAAGIAPDGQRLPHLIMGGELRGLIISGPRRGRDFTFALLDERVPATPRLSREEAVHRLVLTYFRSHGPAQLTDFTWWSGLTLRDARAGIAAAHGRLDRVLQDGREYFFTEEGSGDPAACHLLANYDEYTVAYRDRSGHEAPSHFDPFDVLGNVVLIGGRIRGLWRRQGKRLLVQMAGRLTRDQLAALEAAAAELAGFAGLVGVEVAEQA